MTDITLKLRNLHPKQMEIKHATEKRRVIVAGRRVGKTTLMADIAIEGLLAGKRVLYCAPVHDQTEAFWDEVTRLLTPLVKAGILDKNETLKRIKGEGFGRIRAKTGHRADSLRGDNGDIIIMDEYSLMDADIWDKVIAPMLLDNDGTIYFIFTPKMKNHAYKLYIKAKHDETGRWAAWNFSSHENPHLSAEALQEITADMTADAYQQEIMAQFLDGDGQVFRRVQENMTSDGKCDNPRHLHLAGVDWGKHNDYTVISVGCRDCMKELYMDRFNQIDYSFQRKRLVSAVKRFNVRGILAERNSIGEPNIEELQRAGIPMMQGDDRKPGWNATGTSKPILIETLALSLEEMAFAFLPVEVATDEMEAYEQKQSSTGKTTYNAPTGKDNHDDTVIARALAVRALTRYRSAVIA